MCPGWPITPVQKRSVATPFLFLVVFQVVAGNRYDIKDHNCELELFKHYPRYVPTKVITSIIAPRLHDNGRVIRPRDVIGEMKMDHGI